MEERGRAGAVESGEEEDIGDLRIRVWSVMDEMKWPMEEENTNQR